MFVHGDLMKLYVVVLGGVNFVGAFEKSNGVLYTSSRLLRTVIYSCILCQGSREE